MFLILLKFERNLFARERHIKINKKSERRSKGNENSLWYETRCESNFIILIYSVLLHSMFVKAVQQIVSATSSNAGAPKIFLIQNASNIYDCSAPAS